MITHRTCHRARSVIGLIGNHIGLKKKASMLVTSAIKCLGSRVHWLGINTNILVCFSMNFSIYIRSFHTASDSGAIVCGALSLLNRHGSCPLWEKQSLCYSFNGKLVLGCKELRPPLACFLSNSRMRETSSALPVGGCCQYRCCHSGHC